MNRQFILCGLIGLAVTGVSARIAMANGVEQTVNQPLCFMQHPPSQQQDLTKICGQSAVIPAAPVSQLDPKAPVNFNMPRSRTPSALWNTVPDSGKPIEIGKTYTPTPNQSARPITQPQSAAQAPSGDEGVDRDD
jgi:hypothetical protein